MTDKIDLSKQSTPAAAPATAPVKRGISWTEALICVLIVVILAAIALPLFLSQRAAAENPLGISDSAAKASGAGTASNPIAATPYWFNTAEGAVRCLTSGSVGSREDPMYSCNWDTLKKGQTLATAKTLPGKWITTPADGKAYCVTSKSYGDQFRFECDWVHATTASVSR